MRTAAAFAAACMLALATAAPAPAAGGDEALDSLVADVAAKVAEATGVEPAAKVRAKRVAAGDVAKLWDRRLERVGVPERFRVPFAAFGVAKDRLRPMLAGRALADTGAFLDAEEGVLYVSAAVRRPVRAVAAELVRSARGWEDFLSAGPGLELDGFLARLAIAEGEASLVSKRIAGEAPEKSDWPEVVTAYLRGSLAAGEHFLTQVRAEDGARGVARLYVEPPESTEQVLHPEKRLPPADRPDRIVLPDLADAIPDGWEPAGEETIGEEGLVRVIQAIYGNNRHQSAATAMSLATGWDGDRLRLYRTKSGDRTAFVWVFAFDSRREARDVEGWTRAFPADRTGYGPLVSGSDRAALAGGFGAAANQAVAGAALRFERRHGEGDTGHRGRDAVTSRRSQSRLLGALVSRRDPWAPPPEGLLLVRLSVRDGKTVFSFEGRTTTDSGELDGWIATAADRRPRPPGEIAAAGDVPHESVIRAIDAFMKAGVTDITFRGE